MDKTGSIHTSTRKNPVDSNSFGPDQAPLTPRRNGFNPLDRYNVAAAPAKPAGRTVGTLDRKTSEAFREGLANLERRSSLPIGSARPPYPQAYSYLADMSALAAVSSTLAERGRQVLTPTLSPRDGATSPSQTDSLDSPPLEILTVSPEPPTDHLSTRGAPPVPKLMLSELVIDSEDAQYFNRGEPITLNDLNEFYALYIPIDYADLDPAVEENHGMQVFRLSPDQIASMPTSFEAESITFGRCAVNDPTLESICIRNRNLRRAILFNCLKLQDLSFLMQYPKLQEICLSWCTELSPNSFADMPEGIWPDLTTLQLANTPIIDETLNGMSVLPELSSIDLSHCREISDNGFLRLMRHPKLKQIKIEGANVSDEAIITLREFRPDIQIIGTAKTGLEYYLTVSPAEVPEEITFESAEYYPFLRRAMFEVYGIDSWTKLSELAEFAKGIEGFFEQELGARGLRPPLALNTPQGWFQAERMLQEHDGPNLSKIMDVLVPQLQKEDYFKKPATVEDSKKRLRGKTPFVQVDCFMALWEMTYYPRMLNKITRLDLSGIGLTEVPLSFARLYFSQLKELSIARNPLVRLPRDVLEVFPGRKVQNFFSKYPSLERLDCSECHLVSLEGVFSFLSPANGDDEPERVSILPNLQVADFSGNEIAFLPDVFGISPDRIAERLVINLQQNRITQVQQNAADDLESSSPVKFVIDLRNNVITTSHVPKPLPMNLSLLMGTHSAHLLNGVLQTKPFRRSSAAISPRATTDAYDESKG